MAETVLEISYLITGPVTEVPNFNRGSRGGGEKKKLLFQRKEACI